MLTLANPAKFMALSARVLPWLLSLTAISYAVGLPLALRFSPPDYQQGEAVRIMYIHVPAAMLSMLVYGGMAVAAFCHLVWRAPLADIAAACAAPIGTVLTAIALATGMLWGKPMWGAFWVWDARLTSVLVMFFIYLGVIALRQSIEDSSKAARASAILILAGTINLPIIHFSVYWWNTLHQQSSLLRAGGPSIAAPMLWPLLIMFIAYGALSGSVLLLKMRTAIIRTRLKSSNARPGSSAVVREVNAHA